MRVIIVLAVLVALLTVFGDARTPLKGDYVSIQLPSNEIYWGNITSLGDGLICLNCTAKMAQSGAIYHYDNSTSDNPFLLKGARNSPREICFGTNSIQSLSWMAP
jgi:hypothetical protein